MIVAAVAVLLFWSGWAVWSGARLVVRAGGGPRRVGGAALVLAGLTAILLGFRLLTS